MTHPEFELLIAYHNRQLDDDERTIIEQHLTVCPECQMLLVKVQALIQRLQGHEGASVQPELIQRAVAAFRQVQRREAGRAEIDAAQLLDSWQDGQSEGARGRSTERQLLFHFADIDIDVQLLPDADSDFYSMQGQILRKKTSPDFLEGVAVSLLQNQELQPLRQTLVDHLGRFQFSHIPVGHYLLQVELHDAKVHVGPLSLATADS